LNIQPLRLRITPGELDWVERASGTAYVVLTGDPQSEGLYIQRNRTLVE